MTSQSSTSDSLLLTSERADNKTTQKAVEEKVQSSSSPIVPRGQEYEPHIK